MRARIMLFKHPETGVYYFRKRIPKEYIGMFGTKKELKVSLRTKNLKEANRLIAAVEAAFNERFGWIDQFGATGFPSQLYRQSDFEVDEGELTISYVKNLNKQVLDRFYEVEQRIKQDPNGKYQFKHLQYSYTPDGKMKLQMYRQYLLMILENYYINFMHKGDVPFMPNGVFEQKLYAGEIQFDFMRERPVHPKKDLVQVEETLSSIFTKWKHENKPRTSTLNEWTLSQIGYLEDVITHYSETLDVYERVNQQIIDRSLASGVGGVTYDFNNTYNFQEDVLFALGNSTVSGVFEGDARKEKGFLVINGIITYRFYDEYKDPASFVERLVDYFDLSREDAEDLVGGSGDIAGTVYPITDRWQTKFNATVAMKR